MINYLQIEMDMFLKYKDKEKAIELARYKQTQDWVSPAFYEEIVKVLSKELNDPSYLYESKVRLLLDSYLPEKERLTIPDIDWFRKRFLSECGLDEDWVSMSYNSGIPIYVIRNYFAKKLTKSVQTIILWEWKNVNPGNAKKLN